MQLNLPIFQDLSSSKNILLVGMGGGYDIFCGLPIFYELKQQNKTVHLANLTTSFISPQNEGYRLNSNLIGIGKKDKSFLSSFLKSKKTVDDIFCEKCLSEWLEKELGEETPVWCFLKSGVKTMVKSYQQLIEKYNIDTVVLVDGGVDSLIKGDESEHGTWLEDVVSLCAVRELKGVKKHLVCLGFGTERDVFYGDILENIAQLTKINAFNGSCSLIKTMPAYHFYEKAVGFAHDYVGHKVKSVVNASIISATKGEYGDFHLTDKTIGSLLWINPLMQFYWFFDLDKVSDWNLICSMIRETETFDDVLTVYNNFSKTVKKRGSGDKHLHFEIS